MSTLDELPHIGKLIAYTEACESPLSSEAFIVSGHENYYVYDVGNSAKSLNILKMLDKPIIIILSHFHIDHCGNLSGINYHKLYLSGKARQKLKCGETIPINPMTIQDGVELVIQRCSSVHENGCLLLTINREYTLLGDLVFPLKTRESAVAREMIKELEKIDTRYFVISHRKQKVWPKEDFISIMRALMN